MEHPTVIYLLALLILPTKGDGFTLFEALNSTGSKCGEEETVSASNFSIPQESWFIFGAPCSCNPLCAHYKDCCKDSKYFVAEEQFWEPATSTCSRLRIDYRRFHMKQTCRSDWDNDETRASCRTDSGPPLTSHRTNISYANTHCAVCNYDFDASTDHLWPVGYTCYDSYYDIYDAWNCDSYEAWITSRDNTTDVQLNCTDISHSYSVNYSFPFDVFSLFYFYNGTLGWLFDLIALTRYESHSKGDFNESEQHYLHREENTTQFSGSDYNYKCRMLLINLDENIMRRCSEVISTCASDWADSDVEAMCLAYTDYYCNGMDYFRNPHCAFCNHVDLYEAHACYGLRKYEIATRSDFSELLDWEEYSHMKPDPDKQNTTISWEANDGKLIFSHGLRKYAIKWRFAFSETLNLEESSHMKTDPDKQNTTILWEANDADKQNSSLDYITIVGICLSVSCIVLHLAIFVVTPRLMNLPAMNLAALCVALLLLYCSFFAGTFLEPPCVERAIITHYSLLATFCWMLIISFDVWRTIIRSTRKLQRSSGSKWKRFSVYSVFCWVVPVLVMVPALVIEFSGLDTNFRPGYGQHNCWFSNSDSLLVFVVAPLCVVMAVNVVLFSWSAYLIYSTKFKIENKSTSRADFRLFLRLALIMGLTWLTGLIAGVVKLTGVWYVFVILNTLQGLFIFVAFSCTKKVYKELRRKKPPSAQSTTTTAATSGSPTLRCQCFWG